MLVRLPADLTQVPNIFIDLLIAGKRVGFVQLPVFDNDSEAISDGLDIARLLEGTVPQVLPTLLPVACCLLPVLSFPPLALHRWTSQPLLSHSLSVPLEVDGAGRVRAGEKTRDLL